MVRIYHSLFIYGSVEGHWGWFQFLANTIKLLWINKLWYILTIDCYLAKEQTIRMHDNIDLFQNNYVE